MQAVSSQGEAGAGLEPGLAETMVKDTQRAVQQQLDNDMPAVLLVPPLLRAMLSRFLRRSSPDLKVISHTEVPDGKSIRVTAMVGSGA